MNIIKEIRQIPPRSKPRSDKLLKTEKKIKISGFFLRHGFKPLHVVEVTRLKSPKTFHELCLCNSIG